MRYWFVLLFGIAATMCCRAEEGLPQSANSGKDQISSPIPSLSVKNLATNFVDFWDETRGQPTEQRVAIFKEKVGSRFAAFYANDHITQAKQDERIAHAIESFEPIRSAYIAKIAQFDADLPRHLAKFNATFPDFQPKTEIYLLHSLGEMDGGTRELQGKAYLIFGVDGMVHYHGDGNEAAFFHHELFHVYHEQFLGDCAEKGVWAPLWSEGLAVYVSKVLNPTANNTELLLDLPAGTVAQTEAQLPAAFEQLEQVLASDDEAFYPPLFQFRQDETGLARRRGYFLGYLVAREIGKTRDLRTLAKLSCHDAHDLVFSTVHSLKLQAMARYPNPN